MIEPTSMENFDSTRTKRHDLKDSIDDIINLYEKSQDQISNRSEALVQSFGRTVRYTYSQGKTNQMTNWSLDEAIIGLDVLRSFQQRGFKDKGYSISYWLQISQWLALMISLTLLIFSNENEVLSKTVLMITIIQILMRCMIISVRYATTNDSSLQSQKQRIFSQEEMLNEWVNDGWISIKPKQLDAEIKNCMIRNEVENVFFKFKFFLKMNEYYKDRLLNFNYVNENPYDPKMDAKIYKNFVASYSKGQEQQTLKRSQISDDQTTQKDNAMNIHVSYLETPSKDDLFTYFPGRQVLREQFLAFRNIVPTYKFFKFFPLAISHCILPLIIEFYQDCMLGEEDYYREKYRTGQFWTFNILLLYFNIMTLGTNLYFIALGSQDMKRRMVAMRSCESHLEPNRFKIKDIYKAFPLINFFDPKTLLSWMDLRIMYLDMGRRFFYRFKTYATVYLIFYSFAGTIFLAWYFVLYQEYTADLSMIVTIVSEILITFLFLYKTFYYGAQVNEISNSHLLRLSEIKSIMQRFLQEWEECISSKKINDVLLNNTYKNAFLYFKYKTQDVGPKCGKMDIKRSLEVLEAIQERLEKEIQFNPITILNIPLNMTIINAIRTSFFSLIIAMINFKIKVF
ncbi:UNKNOWN [Stylonychia lemnae]|uniref:Transmembrane protein n=1 Tax=Stylonychia lemnae TaxID=5949 RepID=A0A078A6G7_STYLE|nr:UNKNOWN [Stylonychia lemnae]|eukprot:CDW77799.1 UNKNOWN [Stylonychia lemnae]